MSSTPPSKPRSRIEQISTQWSKVNNPSHFVIKYAPAIRRYLDAMIKNPHDSEDVLQEFLMRVTRSGFVRASADRGRFRDYLKTAIRYTAMTYHRKRPKNLADGVDLSLQPDKQHLELVEASDQKWLEEWRNCLMQRAWTELRAYERKNPAGMCYTVLRLAADHPEEDSKALAARTGSPGRPSITPDAFRKQVSRARRLFAEFIVMEVARTIDEPSAEKVEEELIETGMMDFVKDFLPPDWRTRADLAKG